MKVISVNVARPRLVMGNGGPVSTAIFKTPVAGRVTVRTLNIDGDRQADLLVHGGPSKAVYVYPSEHYEYWQHEFSDLELPYGMFGENLTTLGLNEDLNIGDELQIGSAVTMITEPRMPCYKLGIRFGRADVIRKFLASGLTGFYLSVLQEGEVGAGDEIKLIKKDQQAVRVSDITRLFVRDKQNADLLRRALGVNALPESWKEHFRKQLDKLTGSSE